MTIPLPWSASPAYVKAITAWLTECNWHGQVHGSRLRDLLIENGAGATCCDDDSILRDLDAAGIVTHHHKPAMTTSQSNFFGLLHKIGHPGWGPETRTHYYYFPGSNLPPTRRT